MHTLTGPGPTTTAYSAYTPHTCVGGQVEVISSAQPRSIESSYYFLHCDRWNFPSTNILFQLLLNTSEYWLDGE